MALAASRLNTARPHGFYAVRASAPRRIAVCVRAEGEKPSAVGKAVLVDKIAKEAGITKAQATKAFETLISTVTETVTAGQKVTVLGFGTFESRERKARTGRNPRTGEQLSIPASKTPAFRPSENFKDVVNGKAPPPKPKAEAPKPAAAPKAAAPAPKAAAPAPKPAAASPKPAAPRPAAPAPPSAAVKRVAPGTPKPKK